MLARILTVVTVAMLVAAQPHRRGLPDLGGILGGGGGGGAAATITVTVPGECPTLTHTVTVTASGSGTWGVPTSSSTIVHTTSTSNDHTSQTSTSSPTWGTPTSTSKTEAPTTKTTTTTTKGGDNTSTWGTSKTDTTTHWTTTGTSEPTKPTDPGNGGGQCNSGEVKCCDKVEKVKDTGHSNLLGLLDLGLGLNDLVGVNCSPLSVIGVGGNSCSSQTACCSNNTYNGLINIGCVPINISL